MTEIEFHCPKCEAHLIVEEQFFGKSLNCPHCQAELKVPSVRFPNTERQGDPVKSAEEQDKRLRKEMARFYDNRRKRRQNQRRRIKSMLSDAVLIEQDDAEHVLFPCLHCDEELLVPIKYHGYDVFCPSCGELIEVPDDEDAEFGSSRIGRKPQDAGFLSARRYQEVTAENIAFPGDLEWQRKNRAWDTLQNPALLAGPHAEASPESSGHNGQPAYKSVVGPDGSMLINITLNPDELPGASSRPTRTVGGSSRTVPRPAGGALKTPVKDVKELQVTGEGGRAPDSEQESLWHGNLSARKWEKLVGIAVVAAFLVTMAALGGIFLSRANQDQDLAQDDGTQMNQAFGSGENAPQHQQVALAPEEVEEAKYVIRNYLGSESWRERLGYVRRPEEVGPLMREFYRTNPDGPIRYNSMELTWSGEVRDSFLLLISVIDANFREMFFTLERIDGTFKIDWEVLVQYNPLSWKELKQAQPTKPLPFRVNLKPDNYYNFEFSDRSIYQCYRISNRQEFTGLYAYVRKDAPFFDKIDLDPNFEKLAIVELAYPENPQSRNLVEIVGYVQDGWLKLDAPQDGSNPDEAPEPAKDSASREAPSGITEDTAAAPENLSPPDDTSAAADSPQVQVTATQAPSPGNLPPQ